MDAGNGKDSGHDALLHEHMPYAHVLQSPLNGAEARVSMPRVQAPHAPRALPRNSTRLRTALQRAKDIRHRARANTVGNNAPYPNPSRPQRVDASEPAHDNTPPPHNRNADGTGTISLGFLNMGGGANPMEFLSSSVVAFDETLEHFMTSDDGLGKLLKAIDEQAKNCITERAMLSSYISKKTEQIRALDVHDDANAWIVEQVTRVLKPAGPLSEVPVCIFAILLLADKEGDVDAENKVQGCNTRFNPFNRALNLCDEDGRTLPDDTKGAEGKPYMFTAALKTISARGPEEAFHSMFCDASKRWQAMRAEWNESLAKDEEKARQKWKKSNPDTAYTPKAKSGDPTGVLFYDAYCIYFLCRLLDAQARQALYDHFSTYIASTEPVPLLRSLVGGCDVFAIAENKENQAHMIADKRLMAGGPPDIQLGIHEKSYTAFVVRDSEWKAVQPDFAKRAMETLAGLPQFVSPVRAAVGIEDGVLPLHVTPAQVESFRQRHGLDVESKGSRYEKLLKGIAGFVAKVDFLRLAHHGVPASELTVALVHGKDYTEICKGLETASMVNALMRPNDPTYSADVVVGDFNVTFRQNPLFFASVRALLERMKADPDFAEEPAKTNLAAACDFLDDKGVSRGGEAHMDFDDDVRVVPTSTITTEKTRGFISVQPKKIHLPVAEMKDFVFYKRSKLRPLHHAVVPSKHEIATGTLNTGSWPMDHAGIVVKFATRSVQDQN